MRRKLREYIDTVSTRSPSSRLFTRFFPPLSLPRLPGLVSQCAVCRSWPARQVCQPCRARFAPAQHRCASCALALPADLSMGLRSGPGLCGSCARQRPPLDGALAAVPYAYPWSTLIAGYKFGAQPGWAAFFADMLLQTPGVLQALQDLQASDWIVPVPLSSARLQKRGFNQAWELASALARQSRTMGRADARLLLRVRDTRPQSELKREARLANVKSAFLVDPLRAGELEGRRVLLVDDVMTSGASLFTAARALREAGASHITAVVLARTE